MKVLGSSGGKLWPGSAFFSCLGFNRIFLSLNTFEQSKWRHLIFCSQWPVVRHNSISSLCDTVLRSQTASAVCVFIYWQTLLRFQLGKAGLRLKTILKNLLTMGTFSKEIPWMVLWEIIKHSRQSLLQEIILLSIRCLFHWSQKGNLHFVYDKTEFIVSPVSTNWCDFNSLIWQCQIFLNDPDNIPTISCKSYFVEFNNIGTDISIFSTTGYHTWSSL